MKIYLGNDIAIGQHAGISNGVQMGGGGGAPVEWFDDGSDLANSLTAYWKLNEASGARADSVGSNTLTDNNTVTSTTGRVYALAADFLTANSEYLSVASNASIQMGDYDWWISCWVWLDDNVTAQQIVAKDATSQRDYALAFNTLGLNRFHFWLFTAAGGNVHADVALPSVDAGVWYNLIAWHDATANTISLSVNAAAPVSVTTSAGVPNAGTGEFRIGARALTGNQFMDGRVGPVMMGKNHLIVADDRTRIYNGGLGLA